MFIVLSTRAPKEVNANRELYDLIYLRNRLDCASPSNLRRLDKGAGGLLKGFRSIFPTLQQRLYTTFLFDRFVALFTRS